MVQLSDRPVQATISNLLSQQRTFFRTGRTQPFDFRMQQLQALRQAVVTHQEAVLAALHQDLRKPEFEAYATEIGVVREIDHTIKHLKAWMKPKTVAFPIDQFPAKAKIHPEPLGVALIIGPWNYPFQLMLSPLVGAIAAGNCAILKPSELAPATSQVIAELVRATFDPAYIAVVEGDAAVSQALLAEKFDHIFFTGGTAIGKIVMKAAAEHLTPVTLELGGKSPCIVDRDVAVKETARRIAWGKFINTGQTCIAPDYLLVDRQIKPALLDALQAQVREFYGEDPAQSPDYGRIINDRHFSRLQGLLESSRAQGQIVMGGQVNAADRYMAPTIIDGVTAEDPLMQEEIFGPLLPVLTYDTLEEAIAFVGDRPKPLALYVFSRNKAVQRQVLAQTSSGNACVNDTIMQVGVSQLPFGGVGDSGMGSYHGKAGFETFSHFKSVLYKSFWLDLKWRYAPYAGNLKLLKKFIG
jgi:aldehyde dehydrogenase (NAD+)